MVAFTYRMPAGIPGVVNRVEHATIEAGLVDSTTPPTAYGVFVKTVAGKVQPVASGDAAAVVKGVNVRPYPSNSSQDGLGTSTPNTSGATGVLKRGYIFVKLAQGTAAKDGVVYVRVTAASGKFVGDIEAAADSTNNVVVPGAYFTGAADAGGIVELAYNI